LIRDNIEHPAAVFSGEIPSGLQESNWVCLPANDAVGVVLIKSEIEGFEVLRTVACMPLVLDSWKDLD
jgi:hypothetical protein